MKTAIELVERLLEEEVWARFFQFSCERGPDRLTSQTWQWCGELKARGHRVEKIEVEDALLELAHELLSGADPHSYLFNRASRWIGSRPFETSDAQDAVLNEAFYGALPEYREALRVWAKAGLEAGRVAA